MRSMDAIDFRTVRNVLQPIFMGTIVTPKATHKVLVLSDTGSTVGFTVKAFIGSIGISPSGLWKGHLETVNEVRYHEINFYKVRFISPNGGEGGIEMVCVLKPLHLAKEILFLLTWLRMLVAPSRLLPLRSSRLAVMLTSYLDKTPPPSC